MRAARERLALPPIGADSEFGHWPAAPEAYDLAPDPALRHVIHPGAEQRAQIAWPGDTFSRR